ncbi:MAG: GGDEF domain-containing protein, partial [Gemmatimonadaceae bacterium]
DFQSSRNGARFWDAPEQFLLDAGMEGEKLIARARIALSSLLLLIPINNLLLAAADERLQHVAGLLVTGCACLLSIGVYWMVTRDRRERWLPLATSCFDVTLITTAQIIFAFVAGPQVVVNSKITFDTYFIALAGTCLRFDKRVALLAGVMAILQFCGTIFFVSHHFTLDMVGTVSPYGRFQWADQVSHVVLLATFTALNVYIVQGIQKQRKLSNADSLTGVFNRRFFDDYVQSELARAARYNGSLSVAMVDIDFFKQFNDHHGHAAGDRALQLTAQVIERGLRRSDLVARYGGEEFVIILHEANARQAFDCVEQVRVSVSKQALLSEEQDDPRVTVSAGVATWPADGRSVEELLAMADRRLFVAKGAGRNCVVGSPLLVESAAS